MAAGAVLRGLGRLCGLVLLCKLCLCAGPDLAVQVDDPSRWASLLSAVGLEATRAPARFRIVVAPSPEAAKLGFEPAEKVVRVAQLVEARDPKLEVFWEHPLELPLYTVPEDARIFTREKRTGAPLVAGISQDDGGILWLAADPGPEGYERFPYLVHSLVDLGLRLPLRGSRTWAFFDYSYRTRADPTYLARRWREAGITAVHVSAWPFHDRDPERDRYLDELIEASHREAVVVYAWLELPHVSEGFWQRHPECREKTAALQDAHLDWRKLVNLADPQCFQRVAEGVIDLLSRFAWDGVNLAELYFESLHGPSNPQRFTPLNSWVREGYRTQAGFDPLQLFDERSRYFWSRNEKAWKHFVDYRAELALSLQRKSLELIRSSFPALDIVVTQIDDRFDTRMREYLGADTAALLPLAGEYDFRLVVEDPATLWNLGPKRYAEIAERYRPLAKDPERLAIDINIVERYQQTYPTKKQVGGEFLQLVHIAGSVFPHVLLYFEHSISRPDWHLLPFAAAAATVRRSGTSLVVDSRRPVGLNWPGHAAVDGKPWPVTDGSTVWLPAGRHEVTACDTAPPLRLLYLNADLVDARWAERGLEIEYHSKSRAIAILDQSPASLLLDGTTSRLSVREATDHWAVLLPPGHHTLQIKPGGLLR